MLELLLSMSSGYFSTTIVKESIMYILIIVAFPTLKTVRYGEVKVKGPPMYKH